MSQINKTINTLCTAIAYKFKTEVGKIADELHIRIYIRDTLIDEMRLHEKEILAMSKGEFEGWMEQFCKDTVARITVTVKDMLFEKLMKNLVAVAMRNTLQQPLNKGNITT